LAYAQNAFCPGVNIGQLYALLKMWAKLSHKPLFQLHCESDEIINVTSEMARKAGMTGLAAWNAARPNISEELAVRTACFLAGKVGVQIYIVHVSTKEGVEAIAEAQNKGIKVIGETCTHYLSLTDDSQSTFGKTNPPIRKQADVDALWHGIESEIITCVGTDHVGEQLISPFAAKTDDIWTAAGTFPGMETTLPVMITQATKRGIPFTRVAEVCSLNNAKTFGLLPKKGTIAVGSDADLVVVDLKRRKTIVSKELWSTAKYTPFEGMECIGWPALTMLRGQVIFKDNTISSNPRGHFVPIYPE
jgi:dihydropyrimidinase